MVRAMLIGAPHIDRRYWHYAWILTTRLHNSMPHKYFGQGTDATVDVIKPSPYETITGTKPALSHFKPFGLPIKCHVPVEKRTTMSDPKLRERANSAYYLCPDPTSATKIVVQNAENGNISTTGFWQPAYSLDSLSKLISNANLQNSVDLSELNNTILAHHTNFSLVSKRKEVTAIQILDVSVTNDDNDELVGIVQISNRTLDKKPIWMLIDNYLIGNKSRTFIHKQMLFSFLNKHFAYTTNIFYPIFVQSDVKVTIGSGKAKKIKTYPGIIIGTDANSFKGYRVALFETDTGQENVCDLHDCSAKDIVQFEVANILAPCLADFQPEVRFEDRIP